MNIHVLSSLAKDCQRAEELFQNKEFSECVAGLDSVLTRILNSEISIHETPVRSWFFYDQSVKVKRIIYGLLAERSLSSVANGQLFDMLIRTFREINSKGYSVYHRRWDHHMDQAMIEFSIKARRDIELVGLFRELRQEHLAQPQFREELPNHNLVNLLLLEFKLLDKCGRVDEVNALLDSALNTLANSNEYFFEQSVARYYMGKCEFRRACDLLNGVVDRVLQKYQGVESPRFAIDEVICVRGFLDLVELLDDKELADRYAGLIDQANHRYF